MKYRQRSNNFPNWRNPRRLLGENDNVASEERQVRSADADNGAEKGPSDIDDERRQVLGKGDLPVPSEKQESEESGPIPVASEPAEADGNTVQSEASDDLLKSPSTMIVGKQETTAETGSKWKTFLSWIGFNSESKVVNDERDFNSKPSSIAEALRQANKGRKFRGREVGLDKYGGLNDEGDATLRDMAEYLNEKERSRASKREQSQSLDDAPDDVPHSHGKDGIYSDLSEKKRDSKEDISSSTNPISSIRESSDIDDKGRDWIPDHGGLSDVDVRETVRSFARLFAAIDKRLNGHPDDDIHDTHSPTVRKVYTPDERAKTAAYATRSHGAWSKSPFRPRSTS